MDFASFYKKYSAEFPLGLETVYGDLAPEPELKDFRPFFPESFVVLALKGDTFVGAVCSYTCNSPVLPGGKYASNLFFYVKPAWRNTLVPGKLVEITEKCCKSRGITLYNWDVNISSPLVQALEKRPAYRKVSVSFRKEL